jgi:uncharacterized phage-associated protein
MYEARKVANLILSSLDAREFDLTNLKLNKIMFFVQGWALVRLDHPLIRNHFEAWQYGPVVRSIYDAFKPFADRPITRPAEHLNYATGAHEVIAFDDIELQQRRFITSVAGAYARLTSGELVDLTHRSQEQDRRIAIPARSGARAGAPRRRSCRLTACFRAPIPRPDRSKPQTMDRLQPILAHAGNFARLVLAILGRCAARLVWALAGLVLRPIDR